MTNRPSITTWSRLEPRPRASSTAQALNAEVRDAAWMLTRQWQFGEFDAEDAGSIAYAELSTSLSPLVSWRPTQPSGSPARPLDGNRPLEAVIQAEPFTPDLATRVELGTTFVALLAQELAPDPAPPELLAGFRTAFPIRQAPDARATPEPLDLEWDFQQNSLESDQPLPAPLRAALDAHQIRLAEHSRILVAEPAARWLILDGLDLDQPAYLAVRRSTGNQLRIHRAVVADRAAAQFRQVCAGRAVDGVALYQAATSLAPPASLNDLAPAGSATRRAVDALTAWVHDLFGELGGGDPPAWAPDRLEYSVELLTADNRVLAAQPSQDGGFDWHTFDLLPTPAATTEPTPAQPQASTVTHVLPDHVRFRGMPSPRWWEFQDRLAYLGSLQPDQRDLAQIIVLDFVLVYGNDWFILPFSQPLGSLCTVDALVIHDVFGGTTPIPRADTIPTNNAGQWTMFSTTSRGATPTDDGVAPFLLLPAATTTAQTSAAMEEVRFLRDEMANLVWAVEHITENGIGEPWPGHERDLAVRAAAQPDGAAALKGDVQTVTYQLQTTMPEHWLPMLPISIDPQRGQIALIRGAMLGRSGDLTTPAGRLLQPTTPIPEEEVPRSGLQISRAAARTRWTDGSTHLWLLRQKHPAAQEVSSGLRFDQAIPVPSQPATPTQP